jgi:tetratricopeptide (TPR) repeat protein
MSKAYFGLLTAGVLLLVLLAYAPTLGYPYVQDSHLTPESSPVVQRGGLTEIFTSHYYEGTRSSAKTLYRPVTNLSLALERKLGGESKPGLSHLLNILLHAATALMLASYVSRLGGERAVSALSALLFAVHPLLMQGVANVVGRGEILVTLFSLAALLCMSAADRWGSQPAPRPWIRRTASWGAAVLLFLALGSKEIAVATPLLFLAQEGLFRFPRRDVDGFLWYRRAALLAPAALAVTLYLLLRAGAIELFLGLQPILPNNNVMFGLSGVARLSTALAMAGRYVWLLVFPSRLSGDYSGPAIEPEPSLFAPLPLVGLVVLIGLCALACAPWLVRRHAGDAADSTWPRLLSMGALLFLLPYLVVGNLIVLNGAGFSERLIYFPAAGFCILVAAALIFFAERLADAFGRRARQIGYAAIAVGLLAAAWHAREEARMWESDAALFEHTLRRTPKSLRAHWALADIRRQSGRDDEALELYRGAVRLSPEHGPSWGYIGMLLAQRGDLTGAENACRRCVALRPDLAEPWLYLGVVLARLEQYDDSERALRRALLLKPELDQACEELGHMMFRSERFAEAAKYYGHCVRRGRRDLLGHQMEAEARAARHPAAPSGSSSGP